MGLLLIQAIANLYLPDLNADIINNGIATGDNDYIIRTGAFMLGVTLVLGIASVLAVYWGSKAAMGFGRDVGAGSSARSRRSRRSRSTTSAPRRSSPATRTTSSRSRPSCSWPSP